MTFIKTLKNATQIENINPIVTEFFIRDRKLNISHNFIMQSYFAVPKNIKLIIRTILL